MKQQRRPWKTAVEDRSSGIQNPFWPPKEASSPSQIVSRATVSEPDPGAVEDEIGESDSGDDAQAEWEEIHPPYKPPKKTAKQLEEEARRQREEWDQMRRLSEERERLRAIPRRLPALVPSSGGPMWSVTAPMLDRATQRLMRRPGLPPTEDQIAFEMGLTRVRFQQMKTLLGDLEQEVETRSCSNASGGQDASPGLVFVGAAGDHAVFCCLRSYMMRLFRDAVAGVSERESLAITLDYSQDFIDLDLHVGLKIQECLSTHRHASSYLTLRAREFGAQQIDHWVDGNKVKPPNLKWGRSSTGPQAEVYLVAHQQGLLPPSNSGSAFASNAHLDRHMEVHLRINASGVLEPVQLSEGYEIENFRPNNDKA